MPSLSLRNAFCIAPATKSAHGGAQSAVPATKSARGGSQSAAPATTSAHGGSQSAAPATKSSLQETSETSNPNGRTIPSMIRAGSEHDPRPSRNRRSADLDLPASEPPVPLKNTAFRAFAISPQRILYCACHEICTWRCTKCCACHEICTWRFTKCCTCHEICTWRFTKCCACHEICTWRFTKCCTCHEIFTSRNK